MTPAFGCVPRREPRAISKVLAIVVLSSLVIAAAAGIAFASFQSAPSKVDTETTVTTKTAPPCMVSPFSSTPSEVPYAIDFGSPVASGVWGVTVNDLRFYSNESSLALNCPSPTVTYSYDPSVTSPNGTRYLCRMNCSGTLSLSSSLPALHVEGNKVKDASGNVLVLRGVDIQEYGYGATYMKRYTEFDFKYLARQWEAKVVRIPVVPGYWRGQHAGVAASNASYLTSTLEPMVQWVNKYGMYAIIDWHVEGNVNTPGQGANSGDSRTNLTETLAFWTTISQHFDGRPGVLYEIMNEPAQIGWADLRTTAQLIVDRIRQHDNSTIILIGGINWSSDASGALQNPVSGKNLAYADHPYPTTASTSQPTCKTNPVPCWDKTFGDVASLYPIFATEWGYVRPDQLPFCPRESFALRWNGYETELTSYFQARGVSWMPWNWSPNPMSPCYAMLTAGSNLDPTPFGQYVRALLTTLTPAPTYVRG